MSIDHNKAVVGRLFDEVWNGRQFDVIDELYAADYVTFGDVVAVHLRITGTQLGAWGPVPPTGRRLDFEEIVLLTFNADGQVVHQRGIVDNLLGLRQVGVMPTPSIQMYTAIT